MAAAPKTHFAPELHSERLTYTLFDLDSPEDLKFAVELFNAIGAGALAPKGFWDEEQFIPFAWSVALTPADTFGQDINQMPVYTVRLGNSTSGTPIGIINLCRRSEVLPPDFGFAYLPEYQRKGYGTEGGKTILKYWTDDFGMKELIASTDHDNIGSQKTLERSGFVDGGELTHEGGSSKAYVLPGMEKLTGQVYNFYGPGKVPENYAK
jgi:RimJ/RimL family protein N-acetyltransferase